MKTKRLVVAMLLICTMVFILAACGNSNSGVGAPADTGSSAAAPAPADTGSAPEEKPVAAGEPVELTLAHTGGPGATGTVNCEKFAELVEEESGGSVKIKIFGSSSLVAQPEFYDAISTGRVDIVDFQASYFMSLIPELEILSIPGIYFGNDRDKAIYEILEPAISEVIAPYGLKLFTHFPQGTLLLAGPTPVTDPATQLKGKLVRGSGQWAGEAISRWGGSPVSMAMPDVPTALERNTIDYTLTAWIAAEIFSLADVTKAFTTTNLAETFSGCAISLDKWNSLSSEQQAAIDRANLRFLDESPIVYFGGKDAFFQKLADENFEVVESPAAAEKLYNDTAWEIINEKFLPDANDAVKNLIEAIKDPALQDPK